MRLADHRADDGCIKQRVAHGDAFSTLGKFLRKVSINTLLYQNAAACCASLTVVAEDHKNSRIQSAV